MPTGYSDARKLLTRRHEQLKTDFEKFRAHYADIQKFILPYHGRGLAGSVSADEDKDGSKKMSSILDNTAGRGHNVLTAGFQAGMTSPSRPWFKLGFDDFELNDRPEVKDWLYIVEERMRAIFAKTNVYQGFHHLWSELAGFGTGCNGIFESYERVIHVRPFTAGEYQLASNADGLVDSVYRTVWMTPSQLIAEFGKENCSKAVLNMFSNGKPDEPVEVIHAIEPNDDRMKLPNIRGAWRSVYWEARSSEGDKLLRVRGYRDFPCIAPRWFVVGNQTYGTDCPGMMVLPDVKQLQHETEMKLAAQDKVVEPPMLTNGRPPADGVNTFANGLTQDASPVGNGQAGVRPLYQIQPDLATIIQDIQDLRAQIKEGQFNNLFMMIANRGSSDPQMTAREVAERHEEKMMLIGPVLERAHFEGLTPFISRTFSIMVELDQIPPAPEEIQGLDLKVDYVSIFAQAQRMVGISALEQFAGFVANMAQVSPGLMDKVDMDELVDEYGSRTGVPPTVIVDDEEVAKTRAARAQAEQAQNMAAMAKPAADATTAVKNLSETDMGGNSALSALLGVLPNGLGSPPVG
jgi:hypothetical protein